MWSRVSTLVYQFAETGPPITASSGQEAVVHLVGYYRGRRACSPSAWRIADRPGPPGTGPAASATPVRQRVRSKSPRRYPAPATSAAARSLRNPVRFSQPLQDLSLLSCHCRQRFLFARAVPGQKSVHDENVQRGDRTAQRRPKEQNQYEGSVGVPGRADEQRKCGTAGGCPAKRC